MTTHDSSVERNRLWTRLGDAVRAHGAPLPTPLMVVDLDAFDANADDLVRRAAGTPIRVASKSVRVPDLLRRVLARPASTGSWPTRWPRRSGWRCRASATTSSSLPDGRPGCAGPAGGLADRGRARDAHGRRRGPPGRGRLGARLARRTGPGRHRRRRRAADGRAARRPQALAAIRRRRRGAAGPGDPGPPRLPPGRRDDLRGQVAGVQDAVPSQRARSAVVRRIKALSMTQLEVRRREVRDALRAARRGAGVLERRRLRLGRGHRRRRRGHRGGRRLRAPRPDALRPLPVLRPAPGGVLRPPGDPAALAAGGHGARRRAHRLRAERQGPRATPWAPAGLHLTGPRGRRRGADPAHRPPGRAASPSATWCGSGTRSPASPSSTSAPCSCCRDARFVEEVRSYRGHGSPSDRRRPRRRARPLPPATLGAGRLVCVDGPAGSGKTTLGGEVAARLGAPLVHTTT